MEQIRQNPLKNYFRQFKLYLKLPSGTSYYAPGVIKFTDMGEVGIMPMTGKDELILKNPDALLNGEALIEVIKSCVPAVSDPRVLLTNDIDAIITAIRYATYNDSLETELVCPKCKNSNPFKLNLQYSLDNMSYLESEYVVNLDSGLSVFVKPYSFPELLQGLHAQFEQTKVTRALERYYIKTFESHRPEKGYNLTLGGDGGFPTEETKRRMSAAGKGKKKPQWFGSMVSEANKRRVFSPETRAKMSANRKGKAMSPKTRKKISEAMKGRIYSPETIAKKAKAAAGKSPSQETRDKISASLKEFNLKIRTTKESL